MKKVIIICAVVLVIIFIILAVSFFAKPKTNKQATNASQQVFDFTLSVPDGWSGKLYPFQGGESFIIRQNGAIEAETTPTLLMQQFPIDQAHVVSSKISPLLRHGYTAQTFKINGQNVQKIDGQLVYVFTSNGLEGVAKPDNPVEDSIMTYEYKNSIYLIEYKYGGSSSNPELEKVFNGIIASITSK